MKNEMFNMEVGLSIRELEERQEMSILLPTDEVQDKSTKIDRCNNNGVSTTPSTGGGTSSTFNPDNP